MGTNGGRMTWGVGLTTCQRIFFLGWFVISYLRKLGSISIRFHRVHRVIGLKFKHKFALVNEDADVAVNTNFMGVDPLARLFFYNSRY